MKTLRIGIILTVIAGVLVLQKCKTDPPGACTSCPPAQVGTPYDLKVPVGFPQPFIPSDNPMTMEGVELGRHLFFDKRLSDDQTMSCGSCHHQGFAFADTPDKVKSVGIVGDSTRRHAMPIFNLAFQEVFFWDGSAMTLEEQALMPIVDPVELATDLPTVIGRLEADTAYPDMFKAAFGDSKVTAERIGKAIAQFERTIVSANSKFDRVVRLGIENFTPSEQRGFEMYNNETGDCFHCHGMLETRYLMAAFGVDNTFLNNGLKADYSQDEGRKEVTGEASDLGKFKVPSTRNIDFSFPYMHDGSIPDLDSLIEFYNFGGHPGPGNNIDPNMKAAGIGRNWTRQQKEDLVAFLKTMTDYDLLQNPDYADPFQ
jgi:cytochrome c peroxidase